MESQKIKNLLDHKEILIQNIKLEDGILLMIEIMGSMVKEILMMTRLKLIQKLQNLFYVIMLMLIF